MINSLFKFLDNSPVNFLAADNIISTLNQNGFTRLDPRADWGTLNPGDRRYVVTNHSAVIAFVVGTDGPTAPFHIISAHSDSPGFRIKPSPAMPSEGGVRRLNTEVYGGPILYTWFDRPLSVAGRLILRSDDPLNPEVATVNIRRPLLTIPHLAIHFNRAVNEGNPLNKQRDMMPIAGFATDGQPTDESWLRKIVANEAGIDPERILDWDLSLYDTTPACRLGENGELMQSGRLDDLSMVHAAMSALVDTAAQSCSATRVMAIFDNEETGSGTKQGAASPILADTLMRLVTALGGTSTDYLRATAASFMISADNAHAYHPNYPDKYDPTNHPHLGQGPVIKTNANCKYMTDADSAAVFAEICRLAGVPCQRFVNRSDVAGGSTLGNILTSQIPLRGVDMGIGIWAMHSVRETAACIDHLHTINAFKTFFSL